MVKMQEKRNQQLTQNIEMMNFERRTDEPQISILTRSGFAIGSDKAEEKKKYENT